MAASWSLERRLVARMALAYAVLVLSSGAMLLVGLWMAGVTRDYDGKGSSTVIAQSVERDASGRLSIRRTREVERILSGDPTFWAMVRDAHGSEATLGRVPSTTAPAIAAIGPLRAVERTTLWEKLGKEEADLSVFSRDSAAGPVTVAVKLGRIYTFPELIMLIGLLWIALALPIAGVPALVAIPFLRAIVRRTLKPLDRVADQAAAIDVEQLAVRLDGIEAPREVMPLVLAVNAALDRLEVGYARQAQFLADAAHELRTPIAVIQTRLDGAPEDTLNTGLRRDVARLASLAEQLLAFQRYEVIRFESDSVDLTAIARDLLADFAPMILADGRSIAFEGDPKVLVRGDQLAIERALGNLVQNAVEHGGPNILVSASGNFIVVMDDGGGVPIGEQDSIFEPFHRLRSRHTGAVLGLALVRQIMRRHNGSVSMENGRGTGFAITLHFRPPS